MSLLDAVRAAAPGLEEGAQHGKPCLIVPRENAEDVFKACKRAGFDYLANLTAVDWPEGRPGDDANAPVFEVAYNLYSIDDDEHLALQCFIPRDDPTVPSAAPVWKAADWHEREMYDLMGITFQGHPDLRRIMMPDDWEGHPLRKDYDLAQEQFIYREDGVDKVTKDPTRGW